MTKTNMKIEKKFLHNYEVCTDDESTECTIYYYPEASTGGGKDGLRVKVTPEKGNPWIGVFAFGKVKTNGLTGFFTMPDPDQLCVVSKGQGYLLSADNPQQCEIVKAIPVVDVISSLDKNIVVFADHTKLTAYDESGIKWSSERVAWDGFEIVSVSEDLIKGSYYDIRSEKNEFFEVNLDTGKLKDPFESIA